MKLVLTLMYLGLVLMTTWFLPKVQAETIKIAVIDTGFSAAYFKYRPVKLCPTGHYDFSQSNRKVGSTNIHGTFVAHMIADNLKDLDYCLIIYQAAGNDGLIDSVSVAVAVEMALRQGAKYINMSISGRYPSNVERDSIVKAQLMGVEIFAAAGNDGINLANEASCKSFPACYNGYVHAVEAMDGVYPCKDTNYGHMITDKAQGTALEYGVTDQCATSFASPRALSQYVLSHYRQLPKPIRIQTPGTQPGKPSTNTKVGTKTFQIIPRNMLRSMKKN